MCAPSWCTAVLAGLAGDVSSLLEDEMMASRLHCFEDDVPFPPKEEQQMFVEPPLGDATTSLAAIELVMLLLSSIASPPSCDPTTGHRRFSVELARNDSPPEQQCIQWGEAQP